MIRARKDGQWDIEGGNIWLKVQAELLYADNRMVASNNPVWLQNAFDMLTGLFYWVGLKMNVPKQLGMVCHLCQSVGVWLDEAYTRRMTGVGPVLQVEIEGA